MQHERREQIKELLDTDGTVVAQELAQRFGVSGETIRRDLEGLERDGLARRVHGGAVSVRRSTRESDYQLRKEAHSAQKRAIGKAAAALIEDGDTVLITSGTTTLCVAGYLRSRQNLTVITNSLPIAMELSDADGVNVCCLGGQMRREDYTAVGIVTIENLKLYNANKLILGIGCFTPEQGVTDYQMDNALILKQFVASADSVIGVADSSKLGLMAGFRICPASALSCLITDSGVPERQQKLYRSMGIDLVIAGE